MLHASAPLPPAAERRRQDQRRVYAEERMRRLRRQYPNGIPPDLLSAKQYKGRDLAAGLTGAGGRKRRRAGSAADSEESDEGWVRRAGCALPALVTRGACTGLCWDESALWSSTPRPFVPPHPPLNQRCGACRLHNIPPFLPSPRSFPPCAAVWGSFLTRRIWWTAPRCCLACRRRWCSARSCGTGRRTATCSPPGPRELRLLSSFLLALPARDSLFCPGFPPLCGLGQPDGACGPPATTAAAGGPPPVQPPARRRTPGCGSTTSSAPSLPLAASWPPTAPARCCCGATAQAARRF